LGIKFRVNLGRWSDNENYSFQASAVFDFVFPPPSSVFDASFLPFPGKLLIPLHPWRIKRIEVISRWHFIFAKPQIEGDSYLKNFATL